MPLLKQLSKKIDKNSIIDYIKRNPALFEKAEKDCLISVNVLRSEKKRTFRAKMDDVSLFLKFNIPFWDDDNIKQKMINEKKALEIFKEEGVKGVPELYGYDASRAYFNAEVLITNYIADTRKSINKNNIAQLVAVVKRIHSIKSHNFTIPYGDFTKKINGTGYDFINFYLEVLARDIKKLNESRALQKIFRHISLNEPFLFIRKKIMYSRKMFNTAKDFSLIHGHLARHRERKHILIDKNNNIYLIDWENVCFGERDLELASFLYENSGLNSNLKKVFLNLYSGDSRLNYKKIYIYIFLLRLDDLIEEIKRIGLLLKAGCISEVNKEILFSLYKQKRSLLALEGRV